VKGGIKMPEIPQELMSRLREAVGRNAAEGILLSGGLDTSVLAFMLREFSPHLRAFSVKLAGHGEDFRYGQGLCQHLGLELQLREISMTEALEAVPEVIRIRRSFDPALPNDLAIYFALKLAREQGSRCVVTGDGADELFCGYDYMFDLDLESYLPELARRMSFSSTELGRSLGVEVKQPFLDGEMVQFALSVKPELKVRDERGKRYGKWLLRKAFAEFLPEEIVWQDKRPIEVGSGFARLREVIGSWISEDELAQAEREFKVKFLSRDHLFYYRVYRQVVGEIPAPGPGQISCPGCGAGLEPSAFHCQTCGWSRKL